VPVTTSYPGVFIEELPSSTHTVTAAPTSITVFVGYTNPFWLRAPDATPPPFGVATEIFSFADYQALYGGFFNSPWLPDYGLAGPCGCERARRRLRRSLPSHAAPRE
jgi:uncharacterized protein